MPHSTEFSRIINGPSTILAALGPNILLGFIAIILERNFSLDLFAMTGIFLLISFFVSLFHIMIIGFPMLYALSKRTQITLVKMLLVGGTAGVLPYSVFSLLSFTYARRSDVKEFFVLFAVLFAYGAFSALVYWYAFILNEKILKRLDSSKESTNQS